MHITREGGKMTRRRKKITPEQISSLATKKVTVKVYGEENVIAEQEVQTFETEPAYVRVSEGVTKNMGNYESLRIDVAITVPCYLENIGQTFENVSDTVNSMLNEEVDRILGTEDAEG